MVTNTQKLNITEIIPKLKDAKTIEPYLNLIPSVELREYTMACLEKANYTPDEQDLLLLEILCDFGILRGQIQARINPYSQDKEIDYVPTNTLCTLIVSGVLRKIYFDKEKPITSLVRAREEFYELGKNEDIYKSKTPLNDQTLQQIFQNIEAQMGPLTPIETMAPIQRSPQEDFSTAIYIVDNMNRWKK